MTYPQPNQTPSARTSGYEFSDAQNQKLKSAALWINIVAAFTALSGASSLTGRHPNVVAAALNFAIAVLLVFASAGFTKIVQTQGNDVGHLMEALDKFGLVLLIRVILLVIMTLLLLSSIPAILWLARSHLVH